MTTIHSLISFFDPGAPVQANQYAFEFGVLLDIFEALRPMRILEIGTAQGGTLYQWIKRAPVGAQIVAIDLPGALGGIQGTEVHAADWERWAQVYGVDLRYRFADSHNPKTVRWVQQFAPFDFVFIDGDHSEDGARQDLLDYGWAARPGGIVALHDVLPHRDLEWVQVDKVWDGVIQAHPTSTIVSGADQGDKGIGVIYV